MVERMTESGWRGWHERIAQAMHELDPKMTQEEFGKLVGNVKKGKGETKKGKVSTWITGKIEPTLAEFERIAEVTKKPFLWLICGHKCDAGTNSAPQVTDDLDNDLEDRKSVV